MCEGSLIPRECSRSPGDCHLNRCLHRRTSLYSFLYSCKKASSSLRILTMYESSGTSRSMSRTEMSPCKYLTHTSLYLVTSAHFWLIQEHKAWKNVFIPRMCLSLRLFIQAEKALWISQPLHIRLVLQSLHQLHCPSLNTLQHLSVLLVMRHPELSTGFECSLQCKWKTSLQDESRNARTVPAWMKAPPAEFVQGLQSSETLASVSHSLLDRHCSGCMQKQSQRGLEKLPIKQKFGNLLVLGDME